MEVVTSDQVHEHAQVHGQGPERDGEPEPARRAFMKGKATVSGGGGGGGGRFADKRAEADVGTNGPTLTMPKSWELSQFVSIELFRRSPRVVGSLEHDLPEVTRAVPEPHKESRHQHPQKSFDLLSEEFTLLRPLLLSDDVDVRRATSCDLVVSDELLVSRHRPRALATETWARRTRRRIGCG